MKLFNFKFVGRSVSRLLNSSKCMNVVNFDVGGYKCSIDSQDLNKHPGSLLDQFSKTILEGQLISIDRDGEVFKYVNAFLVNGQLPRDRQGALTLDASMLEKIRKEADYFGLHALKLECGERAEKPLAAHLPVYRKMRNLITGMGHAKLEEPVTVVHIKSKSPLLQALYNATVNPAYATGAVHCSLDRFLGGEQWSVDALVRLNKVHNPDLIDGASFDLPLSLISATEISYLGDRCLEYARDVFPFSKYALKPAKLSVHTQSAAATQRTPAQYETWQIGSLIVLLNSDYTGGEMHVSSDNKCTETIPRDRNWVAVHADCTYKMDPVTSGARVSLQFDIVRTKDTQPYYFVNNLWYSHYDSNGYRLQGHTTMPEPAGSEVLSAIDSELTDTSPVIIALQHVYPIAACTQECMRGSDRALYDLLVERYDVQVVSCTVYRAESYWEESAKRLEGALLTPDAIHQKMGMPRVSTRRWESTNNKQRNTQTLQHRSKLFLHHKLKFEHVMHYVPATESGPQDGEAVYLISGLQISKKR